MNWIYLGYDPPDPPEEPEELDEIEDVPEFTVDQIMAFKPCLPREEIVRLFAGRDTLTALDACRLDIQPEHIIWAVCQPGVLPVAVARRWLADILERCLTREREAGREPDPRSWAVIPALRKYPGRKKMAETEAAARAAACDAAWAAARAAACDAAWDAAWAAACDAACDAAWDAAWAAEYTWQVKRLEEILCAS